MRITSTEYRRTKDDSHREECSNTREDDRCGRKYLRNGDTLRKKAGALDGTHESNPRPDRCGERIEDVDCRVQPPRQSLVGTPSLIELIDFVLKDGKNVTRGAAGL